MTMLLETLSAFSLLYTVFAWSCPDGYETVEVVRDTLDLMNNAANLFWYRGEDGSITYTLSNNDDIPVRNRNGPDIVHTFSPGATVSDRNEMGFDLRTFAGFRIRRVTMKTRNVCSVTFIKVKTIGGSFISTVNATLNGAEERISCNHRNGCMPKDLGAIITLSTDFHPCALGDLIKVRSVYILGCQLIV